MNWVVKVAHKPPERYSNSSNMTALQNCFQCELSSKAGLLLEFQVKLVGL